MPGWLVQLSTVVIAFILVVIVGGIVLSIIVPQVRKALFYRAIGSLHEAATRKSHERNEQEHEKEQQLSLRHERERRVFEAVDKLTEGLTNCLGIMERGYSLEFQEAQPQITAIQRAISELQREGPQELQNQLSVVIGQLEQLDQPFTRNWVSTQVTVINAIVRKQAEEK
jgi:hypothetical protein